MKNLLHRHVDPRPVGLLHPVHRPGFAHRAQLLPDFIFQREEPDGSLKYVIVEVKADNQIEDAVVQAKKDFAQQIAVASGMEYRILKSSDADKRHFRVLL